MQQFSSSEETCIARKVPANRSDGTPFPIKNMATQVSTFRHVFRSDWKDAIAFLVEPFLNCIGPIYGIAISSAKTEPP